MDIRNINENIGNPDRIIRALLAVTFVVVYFHHLITGAIGIVLLFVAVAFLFNAVFGYCALYKLFGLRTNRKNRYGH